MVIGCDEDGHVDIGGRSLYVPLAMLVSPNKTNIENERCPSIFSSLDDSFLYVKFV